jgi:hypothetical protein
MRVTRAQANLVRAFAIWTLWVWGTRIWNVFDADNSTGFVVVHVGLAVVSVALAVAALVVVSRVRRSALQGAARTPEKSGSPIG